MRHFKWHFTVFLKRFIYAGKHLWVIYIQSVLKTVVLSLFHLIEYFNGILPLSILYVDVAMILLTIKHCFFFTRKSVDLAFCINNNQ